MIDSDLLKAAKAWLHLHEQALASREAAIEMWNSGQIPRAMEALRAAIAKAEDQDVEPAPRRCEVIIRNGCRCRNRVAGQANGLWVCAPHKKRIERTFAAADKRWRDAGEPESDL